MPNATKLNTQVARDAKQFTRQLMRLADYITGDISQIIRKAVLDLWSNIVERTPVDSGRAKANWSIDMQHVQSVYEAGRSYNPHMSFNVDPHTPVIYIFNNLEYIVPLEEGHSEQAPQGMVSVSLVDFTNHLRNEALRMGYQVR